MPHISGVDEKSKGCYRGTKGAALLCAYQGTFLCGIAFCLRLVRRVGAVEVETIGLVMGKVIEAEVLRDEEPAQGEGAACEEASTGEWGVKKMESEATGGDAQAGGEEDAGEDEAQVEEVAEDQQGHDAQDDIAEAEGEAKAEVKAVTEQGAEGEEEASAEAKASSEANAEVETGGGLERTGHVDVETTEESGAKVKAEEAGETQACAPADVSEEAKGEAEGCRGKRKAADSTLGDEGRVKRVHVE